jgi:hypothetical protein
MNNTAAIDELNGVLERIDDLNARTDKLRKLLCKAVYQISKSPEIEDLATSLILDSIENLEAMADVHEELPRRVNEALQAIAPTE